jgi:hypothetical protein
METAVLFIPVEVILVQWGHGNIPLFASTLRWSYNTHLFQLIKQTRRARVADP